MQITKGVRLSGLEYRKKKKGEINARVVIKMDTACPLLQ
jgi:hypothetical protein